MLRLNFNAVFEGLNEGQRYKLANIDLPDNVSKFSDGQLSYVLYATTRDFSDIIKIRKQGKRDAELRAQALSSIPGVILPYYGNIDDTIQPRIVIVHDNIQARIFVDSSVRRNRNFMKFAVPAIVHVAGLLYTDEAAYGIFADYERAVKGYARRF